MSWHGDAALFEAYASGEIDEARASSLEAHLLRCAACRAGVSAFVPRKPIEEVWAEVLDRVDGLRPRLVERALVRMGVSDHVARLLAATPSLQLSWFAALALALGFAAAAAYTGSRGLLLFLVVAPMVPLAGVAAAYGPGVDPTYEIGLASPMRSYRLLLTRATAVLATSVAAATPAAVALPGLDWTAAAWLLPSLGLTVATLALSTWIRPLVAAGSVAFAWISVVVLGEAGSREALAAFRAGGQIAILAITALCAVVIVRRRETFEIRRQR